MSVEGTLQLSLPHTVVWRCVKGKSRKFYTLSQERDLWGNWTIVRRWGRLDGSRHGAAFHFASDRSFAEMARTVHQLRSWHDYELVADPDRVIG